METTFVAKSLVLNGKGEVLLLVRSAIDEIRPGDLDFPGGGVDNGESPWEAAAREIGEEAGIAVNPEDLSLVYTDTRTSRGNNVIRFLFIAFVPDGAAISLSHEHSGFEWVRLAEVPARFPHPVWSKAVSYLLENHIIQTILA